MGLKSEVAKFEDDIYLEHTNLERNLLSMTIEISVAFGFGSEWLYLF